DGFKKPPTFTKGEKAVEPVIPKSLSVFITRSSVNTTNADDYKLYYSWNLDNASDVHVCNDSSISDWATTRIASPGDVIFA
ncbi:Bgt-20940-3, partial [Blumeria graminis f. sp. tritici]